MRLTSYVFFIFMAVIVMNLFGIQSPILKLYHQQGDKIIQPIDVLGIPASGIIDPRVTAGLIGLMLVSVAVTWFTGFSGMFLIPMILALYVINMLVVPWDELLNLHNGDSDSGMPVFLGAIFGILLNILTIMTLIGFVRGGD